MTPRECVLRTFAHQEPDRVPIDFAGTDCSSIHAIAYDKLRRHLGIDPGPIRLSCLIQMVVECDPEIQNYLGGDVRGLHIHPHRWRSWDSGWGFEALVPERWRPESQPDGRVVIRDAQGEIRLARPAGGFYFDPVSFVLGDIQSPDELDQRLQIFERWDWPAIYDESPADFAARARDLYLSTDRAVVASWRMHYLQAGQIMRGYEQFMVDLLTDEPLARGLLDRLHAAYLRRAAAWLEAMAPYIDIVFLTDDLGTQSGPMISPSLYRRLLKPYWAELIGLIKRHQKKVLMHSCGAVAEFIGDLIEIGVDAINPVQLTAAGMAPAELKRRFGRDIVFWGGGVSTQGVLDRGTPQEVRDEVRRNVDTFAPGGGFVFTQVHNIQHNVPPENIVAAYEAARMA